MRRSLGRSSAFHPLSAAPFAPSGDCRRGLAPVRRNLTIPKGFRIYSTVAFGAYRPGPRQMSLRQGMNMSPEYPGFTETEIARARKHVRRLRGFYLHLSIYVLVVGAMAVANLATTPHVLWFLWSAFGWGIGIVAHGASVLASSPGAAGNWEDRKVRELLERQTRAG